MTNWNDIVREHGPTTYRVAWRILGHTQDCEDVLQEVFMEAHNLFTQGKVTYWPAFLYRLVTFRALDALRRRKPVGMLDDEQFYDPSPGPEEAAIYREEERRLRAAVAELPDRQAAVFCLAYFEQLSHQDIAAALDITRNAVANAFHKARIRLQELLLPGQQKEPKQ
ncbi:RNA polymerase sigma factor [Planctomycetaceae bacterium SH139]